MDEIRVKVKVKVTDKSKQNKKRSDKTGNWNQEKGNRKQVMGGTR